VKNVSHSNKIKCKENHLLNKLLNKSNKTYLIKSFCVTDFEMFQKCMELVDRESKLKGKFSYLVNEALREYVQRHYPGNPQAPLTKFGAKPTHYCYCGAEADYEVWAWNGWHGFTCTSCYERNLNAGNLKKWRRI